MGSNCSNILKCSDPLAINDDFSEKILYIIKEDSQSFQQKRSKSSISSDYSKNIIPQKNKNKYESPKSLNIRQINFYEEDHGEYLKSFTYRNEKNLPICLEEKVQQDPIKPEENVLKKIMIEPLNEKLLEKVEKLISKVGFLNKNQQFKSSSFCSNEDEDNDNNEENNIESPINPSQNKEDNKQSLILVEMPKEEIENSQKQIKVESAHTFISSPTKTNHSTNVTITQKTDNNNTFTSTNPSFTIAISNPTTCEDPKEKPNKNNETIQLSVEMFKSQQENSKAVLPRKSLLKCNTIGRKDFKTKKNKKKVKFQENKKGKLIQSAGLRK